ncbi:unnamed protein product [Discula destructiva]
MSNFTNEAAAGKTCLVTGGAGGLGKAIASAFLKAGANVVICDIKQARVDEASAELSSLGSLLAVVVDITNSEAVESLFEQITTKFGTLDVLVNNAAIMDRFDPVGDLDPELWDKVIAVNLRAPFVLTKLALEIMLKKDSPSGSIINIASGAAKAGWLAGAAYTASKHGLIGLTKSTASYYGPKGIRCNTMMMGVMPTTNMKDAFMGGANTEGMQKVMGLLSGAKPTPCDLGEAAAYAVSLAHGAGASLINGACINVDHGWSSVVG